MIGTALNSVLSRPASRWLLGLLVVLLIVFPFVAGEGGRYYTVLLMTLFIFATLGHAWNLLAGFCGLLSFGTQVYVGLGGFTVAIFTYYFQAPVWVGMGMAAIVTAAFAWLLAAPLSDRYATRNTWIGVVVAVILWIIYEVVIAYYPEAAFVGTPYIRRVIILFLIFLGALPLLRLQGAYFAVATWLIAAAVGSIFNEWRLVGAGGGMNIANATTVTERYFAGLILLALATAVVWWLLNSRYGQALTAVRDDEEAARAVGIDIRRIKTLVFVISAPMAGLAGALYYIDAVTITPPDAFDIRWSAYVVFIVVAGGMGRLAGPIIGAIAFIIVQRFLVGLWGGGDLTLGIAAVLLILVLPRGIAGLLDDLRATAGGPSAPRGGGVDLKSLLGVRSGPDKGSEDGKVVAAVLLPPDPTPHDEAPSSEARALSVAYAEVADRLAARQPDVVVIYAPTLPADASGDVPSRLSGRVTDPETGGDPVPFDFAVDQSFARTLAGKGVPLGLGARGRELCDRSVAVATRRLSPDGSLAFVVIGGADLSPEAAAEAGATVVREAKAQGRRVALVAVGGLSRSAGAPDRSLSPGMLQDPADDRWNRRILGLVQSGDVRGLAEALPQFTREARVRGGGSHLTFLTGALGVRWAGADIRCYSATHGVGTAVIAFDFDDR